MKELRENGSLVNSDGAYFVRSPTDDTVLVAIHSRYDEENKMLSWWDLTKERMKEVTEIKSYEKDGFYMKDREGEEYFFLPLNLDLYRNIVMPELIKPQDFNSVQEMIKAFEETIYP